MTVRMGPKGQVVVPKAVRDRVGFRPGDELVVEEVDGEVRVRRKLTVGDLFAVATAVRHEAPLLTGDPELVDLDVPGLAVVDLRAAGRPTGS